jgi:amino-acid N-acetyltransferase
MQSDFAERRSPQPLMRALGLQTMKFRKALDSDLKLIEIMLKESKLPYEDCKYHLNNFVIKEDDGEIVGIGGAELYDDIALLRSITVLEKYRGKGIGNSIFFKIREYVKEHGVETVYLLTETAEKYFMTLGFTVISREVVPQEIRETEQFSSLCPLSAAVMKCRLQ